MDKYTEALEWLVENNVTLNEGMLDKLKAKFGKKNNHKHHEEHYMKDDTSNYTPEQKQQLNVIKDKIRKVVKKYCDKFSKDSSIDKNLRSIYNKAKSEDKYFGGNNEFGDPKPGELADQCFDYKEYSEEGPFDDQVEYTVNSLDQDEFMYYEPVLEKLNKAVENDPELKDYKITSGWADDVAGLWFMIAL